MNQGHVFNSLRKWIARYAPFGILFFTGCLSPPLASTPTLKNESSHFGATKGLAEREASTAGRLVTAPRERVFWAGVATHGEAASLEKRFPVTHTLLPEFQSVLSSALRSTQPQAFDLANLQGEPVSFDGRDALVMAVAMDRERLRVEPIQISGQRQYRVEFGVQGELVFVDLKEKVVTYSFPISCNAVDVLPARPTPADLQKMARVALFDATRTAGKPMNLKDQFLDQVASRKAVPRSPIEPLAVRRISVADSCSTPHFVGVASSQVFSAESLREWEDEIGSEFASYLASAVYLGVNPYSRDPGGAGDSSMAKFSMQFMNGQVLNARLRPPARVFDIEITSLFCELDPGKSTQSVSCLNYGFTGRVTVTEPELGTVKLSQELDLSLAGLGKRASSQNGRLSGVPPHLRDNYQKLVSRQVWPTQLRSDEVDHFSGFAKSLDNYLFQLKDEAFFEAEDSANRYGPLREDFSRAHLLN